MLDKLKENIDTKIVVSTVVGSLVTGIIAMALIRSGVRPLEEVAKAVK
jgi:hypothetical protein